MLSSRPFIGVSTQDFQKGVSLALMININITHEYYYMHTSVHMLIMPACKFWLEIEYSRNNVYKNVRKVKLKSAKTKRRDAGD